MAFKLFSSTGMNDTKTWGSTMQSMFTPNVNSLVLGTNPLSLLAAKPINSTADKAMDVAGATPATKNVASKSIIGAVAGALGSTGALGAVAGAAYGIWENKKKNEAAQAARQAAEQAAQNEIVSGRNYRNFASYGNLLADLPNAEALPIPKYGINYTPGWASRFNSLTAAFEKRLNYISSMRMAPGRGQNTYSSNSVSGVYSGSLLG